MSPGQIRTPQFEGRSSSSPRASRTMSANRSTGTKPELALRSAVWRLGLRYRVSPVDVRGKPDMVFRSARVAVFCDGDFWHGKDWLARKARLAQGSNAEYWVAKIEANRARDREHADALRAQGWRVLRFWESDIHRDVDKLASKVVSAVKSARPD